MVTLMGVNFHFSERFAGKLSKKIKIIKIKNDLMVLNSKIYGYNK